MSLMIDILQISLFITALYIALIVYKVIFLFFVKVGGRNEASRLLGAPCKPIEKVVKKRECKQAWRMRNFIEKDSTNSSKLSIDWKWVDVFINTCHWCGLQVILRRDGEEDIESTISIANDEVFLEKVSEKAAIFNDVSISNYNKFHNKIEEVKSKFEL